MFCGSKYGIWNVYGHNRVLNDMRKIISNRPLVKFSINKSRSIIDNLICFTDDIDKISPTIHGQIIEGVENIEKIQNRLVNIQSLLLSYNISGWNFNNSLYRPIYEIISRFYNKLKPGEEDIMYLYLNPLKQTKDIYLVRKYIHDLALLLDKLNDIYDGMYQIVNDKYIDDSHWRNKRRLVQIFENKHDKTYIELLDTNVIYRIICEFISDK